MNLRRFYSVSVFSSKGSTQNTKTSGSAFPSHFSATRPDTQYLDSYKRMEMCALHFSICKGRAAGVAV